MVDIKNYLRKEIIRSCPYCRQDIKMKKGLSLDNIKRLFRKPTVEDLIMLFIILLTIISFLMYTNEIAYYKEYIDLNCPLGQQIQDVSISSEGFMFEINNTNKEDEKGEKG